MFVETKREGEVPAVPQQEWQRVLLRAADYLERQGWCQHTMVDTDNNMCVLGAIGFEDALKQLVPIAPFAALNAAIHLQEFIGNGQTLAVWNDAPWRTKDQVIHALRACARGE